MISINFKKQTRILENIKPFAYHAKDLGLDSNGKGYRTKISIISSGLPSHKDLEGFTDTEVFVEKTDSPDDKMGIATMYAGILAANNEKRLTGLAPKTKKYFVKCIDDKKQTSIKAIAASILWSIVQKVDVIILDEYPISNENQTEESEYISQVLKKAGKSNICVFMHKSKLGKVNPFFPYVLDVNSSYNDKFKIKENQKSLHIELPKKNTYTTYLNNKYVKPTEITLATSVASGLALLLIQKYKTEKIRYTPISIYKDLLKLK